MVKGMGPPLRMGDIEATRRVWLPAAGRSVCTRAPLHTCSTGGARARLAHGVLVAAPAHRSRYPHESSLGLAGLDAAGMRRFALEGRAS
jgi:hypothetical protein